MLVKFGPIGYIVVFSGDMSLYHSGKKRSYAIFSLTDFFLLSVDDSVNGMCEKLEGLSRYKLYSFALAKCETSHVLLAGAPGVFSRVLSFSPTC